MVGGVSRSPSSDFFTFLPVKEIHSQINQSFMRRDRLLLMTYQWFARSGVFLAHFWRRPSPKSQKIPIGELRS